ncbi:DNA cytosine methyltransferase [Kitasatospora sp. NPDC051170]|uniref:DNA cytosine methyltransferase n=1 Tax=Kitasatospora sp. NPDC051170 TaxID=3364056 RepID=UPI0037A851D0
MTTSAERLTSVEICAGAGGQAIGLHDAGFRHLALVEIDGHAATALKKNVEKRRGWEWERKNKVVHELDVNKFFPKDHLPDIEPFDVDLLAGGVPCPPFSLAGHQLGQDDERDLFPRMLDLVREISPKAVMIENVRGLLQPEHKFAGYRKEIISELEELGYHVCNWGMVEAADYGVPQLRPRAILIAIHREFYFEEFEWPSGDLERKTVFEALRKSMEERYRHAEELHKNKKAALQNAHQKWKERAERHGVAPTLVGGSKKHGGADLGPSRAKAAWKLLGVDAMGVANDMGDDINVDRDLLCEAGPKLTVAQAAIIQGFPENWHFEGGKTARYRQIGNAFPPPVAKAFGESIAKVLRLGKRPEGEVPASFSSTISDGAGDGAGAGLRGLVLPESENNPPSLF